MTEISFSVLSSVILGSATFGFDSLFTWSVTKLASMWPDGMIPVIPGQKPNALESVRLVRQCVKKGRDDIQFDSILKTAIYELARTGGFGIREEGVWIASDHDDSDSESGTEDYGDMSVSEIAARTNRKRSRSKQGLHNLSPNDVRILIRVRERLALE